ncbi:MFS transporter [uncultured Hyphomonas sp.]|uniref:MFS transporter n=1 Tax=uncultured Hyphomonas sp. TaxID=225298 RepID=UPI002AAA75F7|nr:MFS transporter [uncultured Hyphomonas sp.]
MQEEQTHSQTPSSEKSHIYAWYVVGVLMVAYTFSFLDRYIVNLMVGPIKADLGISDFQFSLMTGAAFGIFYTIMGLPLGWAADRFNRTRLAAIGIALWSMATVLCGISKTFVQLFLARVGVGVGEAALSPAAYSLMSDYFDKSQLPRAISLYTAGIFIGAGLAYFLGGEVVGMINDHPYVTVPLLGQITSWHFVFIAVGFPGLLVALLVLSLKEPARKDLTAQSRKRFDTGEVFGWVKRHKWMSVSMFLGGALYSMITYTDQWYPELFIRTWDWGPREAGRINGFATIVGGPIGLIFAGWLTTTLIRKGITDACLRMLAYASIALAVIAIALPLMPNATLMALMMFPFKFFIAFNPVLVPSAIQMVAPNQLRGQLGALFLLSVGILGVTFGPILPAFLTDFVFKDESALRYSLSVSAAMLGAVTAVTFWVGLKQYREAYAEAETRQNQDTATA